MLHISIANQQAVLPVARAAWRRLLRHVTPPPWRDAQLSITVVDGEQMERLNIRHTGRAGDTDVLAFPLGDGSDPDHLVGEIIVCSSRAVREAKARGIPPESELALYVVHGFVHLIGYDDHSAADRRRMYQMEESIFTDFGLPYVRYAARRRNRR